MSLPRSRTSLTSSKVPASAISARSNSPVDRFAQRAAEQRVIVGDQQTVRLRLAQRDDPADHVLGTRMMSLYCRTHGAVHRATLRDRYGSGSGLWYTLIVNLKSAEAQRTELPAEAHCPRRRDS